MTKPQPKFAAVLEVLPPVLPATLPIDLSASINAAFATARSAADSATHEARAAITAAVQCGDLLTRQKASVPHGAWLAWLAAHCPVISAETARRYMRLSKRSVPLLQYRHSLHLPKGWYDNNFQNKLLRQR